MAVVYAVKSGDWSDTTVWNGGVVPGSGDDVYTNGFDVAFDVSTVTVNKLSNDDSETHDPGGSFVVENGSLTLTFNEIGHQLHSLIKMEGACDVTLDGVLSTGAEPLGEDCVWVNAYDEDEDEYVTSSLSITGVQHTPVDFDYPAIGLDNGTLNLDIAGDLYGRGRGIWVSHGASLNLTVGGDLYLDGSVGGSSWKGFILFDHGSGDPADGHTIEVGGDVYFGPGVTTEAMIILNRQASDLTVNIQGDLVGGSALDTFGIWHRSETGHPSDLTLTVGGELVGGASSLARSTVRVYSGNHTINVTGGIKGGGRPGEATIYAADSLISGSLSVATPFVHALEGNALYLGANVVLNLITGSLLGGTAMYKPAVLMGNGTIIADEIKSGTGDYSVAVSVELNSSLTQDILIRAKTVEALNKKPAIAGLGEASNFVLGTSNLDVIVENALISAPDGTFPVSTYGTLKVADKATQTSNWTMRTVTDQTTVLTNASGSGTDDVPMPSDVRQGLVYGEGEFTGTLAVPTPEQVSFGIPVDATVGQTALNLPQVVDYFGEQIKAAFNIEPHVCPPCPPSGDYPYTDTGYSRPTDWLTIPNIPEGQERIHILVGIVDGARNDIGFKIQGDHTIDWGDGSALQNVDSDVLASHVYDYASLSSSTYSTRGYRQAIITVVPRGSAHITSINFNTKSAETYATDTDCMLEVNIRAPQCATLTLSSTNTLARRHPLMERFVWYGESQITSLIATFYSMLSMEEVVGQEFTANVTLFQSTFQALRRMKVAPVLDTSSATSVMNMFAGCQNLVSVPLYDTSSVTNFSSMFNGCAMLEQAPAFDTSSGLDFTAMFALTRKLRTIPSLDLSSATSVERMFQNASGLRVVPYLDTSSVTMFTSMFENCQELVSVEGIDTSSGSALAYLFKGCSKLSGIPEMDTSSGVSFNGIFDGCEMVEELPMLDFSLGWDFMHAFRAMRSVRRIPAYSFPSGTRFTSAFSSMISLEEVSPMSMPLANQVDEMFNGCISLRHIGEIDLSSSSPTNITTIVSNCPSLARSELKGLRGSHNYSNANLSAEALDEIYTNLGTAVSFAYISVNLNYGTLSDTPSIATAKGWNVTGS